MPARTVLKALETDRLILRFRCVDEAGVYRRLWMERDPRVPAHRRIDAEGRPTVEDIASEIRREREEPRPGVLAVERKSAGDVIGYCGLVFHGTARPTSPNWPTSCCVGLTGSAMQPRRVEPWSLGQPRQATSGCGQRSALGMSPRRVLEKLGFHETGQVDADAAHGDSLLTVRSLSSPAR